MRKTAWIIPLLSVLLCFLAHGEDQSNSLISIHLIPELSIPIGRDADIFTLGGGGSLLARFALPPLPFFAIEAGGGFGIIPISVASGESVDKASMLLGWPWAGVGLNFQLFPGFWIGAHANGGYYFASMNVKTPNNAGRNPMFSAGLDVAYHIIPALSVGVGATYRDFFGLYNDVTVSVGTAYHFQPAGGGILGSKLKPYSGLKIEDVSLDPVFPVFYKYYDNHPIGRVRIRNTGKIPLEDVKLNVFVSQYMDNPKASVELPFVKSGDAVEADLFALFNDKVLEISEPTKVQINVAVECTVAGEHYGNEDVKTLRLYDRNAITWSDNRRPAAFVAAKDPTVLRFSKNVASMVKGKALGSIDANLLAGIAIHEALDLYGMRYQIDPSTPYTEFSKNEAAIDYLQFPNQSLDYKAGDCDDLSILYGALLESLGIQTAFVTVPGHIYLAFALAMPASEAAGRFRRANDLIFLKDRAWLPMEVTMIQGGFLRAWEEGAREWRENSARKQADLYPVHEAWELYEPVGFAGTPLTITLPDEKALLAAYAREVGRFVDAELVPQEAELQKQIQSQGPDPKLINKLGVLYARYGLNDKAEVQFQKALSVRKDFPQALVNIGNLAFLSGDMRKAISYYERAQKGLPDNPGVALGLAKASYELKDYDAAARYYAATKRLDAALAERFAYLDLKTGDSQMRASAAEEMREAVIWGE